MDSKTINNKNKNLLIVVILHEDNFNQITRNRLRGV